VEQIERGMFSAWPPVPLKTKREREKREGGRERERERECVRRICILHGVWYC